jgi:carboxylesterase type B
VSHIDDLFMLFTPHVIPVTVLYTDQDRYCSSAMVSMWTNFAKFADPTPSEQGSETIWKRCALIKH